jgi:hypothetical protein
VELIAVAALELLARDPLRRVLGVQVERLDLDLGAVPAPEPCGPLQADVAERSHVVGPDLDARRLGHGPRLASGGPLAAGESKPRSQPRDPPWRPSYTSPAQVRPRASTSRSLSARKGIVPSSPLDGAPMESNHRPSLPVRWLAMVPIRCTAPFSPIVRLGLVARPRRQPGESAALQASSPRSGDGIEPSKRRAAPPCRF